MKDMRDMKKESESDHTNREKIQKKYGCQVRKYKFDLYREYTMGSYDCRLVISTKRANLLSGARIFLRSP